MAAMPEYPSEELLQTIWESSTDALALADAEGIIHKANSAYLRLCGYTAAQVIGHSVAVIAPTEQQTSTVAHLKATLTGNSTGEATPQPFIVALQQADGSKRRIEMRATALTKGTQQTILLHARAIDEQTPDSTRPDASLEAFRVMLTVALRTLDDPIAIQAEAARLLGEHLGTKRAFYAEAEADGEHVIIHRDYADGLPSVRGRYRLDDFGPAVSEAYRGGKTHLVSDVALIPTLTEAQREVYAHASMRAIASVYLVKGGRLVAMMGVREDVPRVWSAEDVAILEETAERTWAAVERTRAEAELRISQERYRQLFNSIDEGLCIVQMIFDANEKPVDYRFLEINSTFERQTGLVQPTGKTARELVPSLEDHWFETYGNVALTGEAVRFENGSAPMARWFDVYAFRFGEPANRQVAILFKDITENKLATEALRQSQTRLQTAMNAGKMFSWELDLSTYTLAWSSNTEKILGYPLLRTLDDTFSLIHPDDRTTLAQAITAAIETRGMYASDYRLVHPVSGAITWLHSQGMVTESHTDERSHFIGISQDITARKQAEEALRASEQSLRLLSHSLEERVAERTAELQASNLELDQFTYVASHDLKAPLRGIHQLASWIAEDAAGMLPSASLAHLEKLRTRITRMDALLNDLLAYSRAGRQRHTLANLDTNELVHSVVEILAPPSGFTIDIASNMPSMLGERAPLETVFRNLIGNAIKHHDQPKNGHISLSSQVGPEFVEFSIHDNGPGIDPNFHDRIFAMFQTLRPRDQVEGSGIGLALVKRLVESRGGKIIVESDRGEGATFRFTWPLFPSPVE